MLVVSFVALAVLWPTPRFADVRERRLISLPRIAECLAGALGIAAFAVVVYAGLQGSQTGTANLAPTAIYVAFWVGLPLLSLLFGDVFAAINPWRTIARFRLARVTTAPAAARPDGLPAEARLLAGRRRHPRVRLA